MLAAVHIDSFIFLLLVGAAAFMRFLAKKASGPAGDQDEETFPPPRTQNPPPLPRRESQTDEERIRKFLEALGQPASSRPPSPVTPRTMQPPVLQQTPRPHLQDAERSARRVINPLPPLTTVPPPVAVRPLMATLPPVYEVQEDALARESAPQPTTAELAEAFEAFGVAQSAPAVAGPKSDLLSLLKNPEALRQAIILREVFGPPRSLQPFDFAGNA